MGKEYGFVSLRMTREEKERVSRAAKWAGKSVTEWVMGLVERETGLPEVKPAGVAPIGMTFAASADVNVGGAAVVSSLPKRAGFGRDVNQFLSMAKVPVQIPSDEVYLEPDFEKVCVMKFGEKAVATAAKVVPRWDRMSWKMRHDALEEKREREAGF